MKITRIETLSLGEFPNIANDASLIVAKGPSESGADALVPVWDMGVHRSPRIVITSVDEDLLHVPANDGALPSAQRDLQASLGLIGRPQRKLTQSRPLSRRQLTQLGDTPARKDRSSARSMPCRRSASSACRYCSTTLSNVLQIPRHTRWKTVSQTTK